MGDQHTSWMREQIDHVVYVMFENRGFDHMIGTLYAADEPAIHWVPGSTTPVFRGLPSPLPKLPADASFYNDPGNYRGPYKQIRLADGKYCCMPSRDPGEKFEYVTNQIYGKIDNLGLDSRYRMLGFWLDWQTHCKAAQQDEILQCNTKKELPVIHALARAFAVSDDYFSSVPTQTNPNRAFSLAGTSLGRTNNRGLCGRTFDTKTTIFNAFEQRRKTDPTATWKIYYPHDWLCSGHKQAYTRYMFRPLHQFAEDGGHFAGIGDEPNPKPGTLLADAANGSLPALSYVEPVFIGERLTTSVSSYHPPSSLKQGELLLRKIYRALRDSPVWDRTLLLVNFDEHGGTYDHVPPPTNATAPDDSPSSFDFTRFGVRVPFLAISPWIADKTVLRPQQPEAGTRALPFDHSSIIATLCKWKQIPYQDPSGTISYEFGARARLAPTLEHVFSDTLDLKKPKAADIPLPSCDDANCHWFWSRAMVRFVEAAVTKGTGLRTGSPEHTQIMSDLRENCSSIVDVTRRIEGLRSVAREIHS